MRYFYYWPGRSVVSADVSLRGLIRQDRRGGGEGAGDTESNRVVAGALGKRYVGRRADEEVRKEFVISIGASPHEQLAAGSSRADSASTSPSTARPTIESTG
jgi:chorismate synthase